MAQRWAMQKLERIKRQRMAARKIADENAGLHPRFHDGDELTGSTPWELTEARTQNAIVPAHVEPKRITCKGIMPPLSMGRVMRKARHQPVKLWTGTDGNKSRIPAPPQGSLMARCWDRSTEWRIVRK